MKAFFQETGKVSPRFVHFVSEEAKTAVAEMLRFLFMFMSLDSSK